MREKRCLVKGKRVRFFNYKLNGQCSCAIDKCQKRFQKSAAANSIYAATEDKVQGCQQGIIAKTSAYGVCQPSACDSSSLLELKKPRYMKRCAGFKCTVAECCKDLASTTPVPIPTDPACFPPVTSAFKLAWDPPACLYTIPGAGNTMTRLLIDAVLTGYHSGSVYHDRSLVDKLPGELTCTRSASVIKIHPNARTSFSVVFNQHSQMVGCKRCIPDAFVAAVVVVRDPVHSFFANYNLKRSSGTSNRHTNRIKKSHFNRSDFEHKLIADADATRIHYHRDFLAGIKAHLPPSHYVFVTFEALTSRDPVQRRAALRSIVEFLAVNGTVISDAQLDRAFASAQSEHRPPPQADELRFEDAFTPELLRRYWARLGHLARVFGYGPNASMSTRGPHAAVQPSKPLAPSHAQTLPELPPVAGPSGSANDAAADAAAANAAGAAGANAAAAAVGDAGSGHLHRLYARGRSVSPFPLIVVMATRASVLELLNFAESVRRSRGDRGLRELTVLTTGARPLGLPAEVGVIPVAELATEMAFPLGKEDSPGHQLWIFRIKLIAALLDHGVHVLLSDLDAVWMRDPHAALFARLASADIVAQRAAYPSVMGRSAKKAGFWGATVCMGFALFRSTNATRTFLRLALRSTAGMNDGQRWINYNLYKHKISWPETRQHAKIGVLSGPTTVGRVPSLGLDVALLDPAQVGCAAAESSEVVEHCVAGHDAADTGKIEQLKKRHAWLLRHGALALATNASRLIAWHAILDNIAIGVGSN